MRVASRMAAARPLEALLDRLEAAAGDVAPAAPSSAAEVRVTRLFSK